MAKEIIAGFAAAEVDKLFETKGESITGFDRTELTTGLDAFDREEAKRHARRQAEQALDQSGMY